MAELNSEQKQLIRAEFEECLKDHEEVIAENKKVLNDIRMYKRLIRLLIGVVLGGSIATVLYFPSWVDERIVARAMSLDDLVLANGEIYGGDYRQAFERLASFVGKIDHSGRGHKLDLSSLTEPQQRFLISTLIGAFALNSDKDPTSLTDFVGKDMWRALLSNSNFKLLFPKNSRGFSDSTVQNYYMGLAYLRYADDKSDVEQGSKYLSEVLSEGKDAPTGVDTTSAAFYLGFALSLLDRRSEAMDVFAQSQLLANYTTYQLTYGKPDASALLGSFNQLLLGRLWKKFGKDDFGADVCSLLRDGLVAATSASVDELKDDSHRGLFVKEALKQYEDIRSAIARKDFDSIIARMPPAWSQRPKPFLERYLENSGKLDPKELAASIYGIAQQGDSLNVGVRFFSTAPNNGFVSKPACEGSEQGNRRNDEIWNFSKSGATHDWQITFYGPPVQ